MTSRHIMKTMPENPCAKQLHFLACSGTSHDDASKSSLYDLHMVCIALSGLHFQRGGSSTQIGQRQCWCASQDARVALLPMQAWLAGGEWAPLLSEGHVGVPEVKWSPNRMQPFLCIGPSADASPGEREAEEFIEASRLHR